MPEHLRALVVILAAAAVVFLLAEKPLVGVVAAQADYRRRRNVWFAVTLIGFLAMNFWLYVLLCGALVAVQGHRDSNPLALYCLLLFAIPPFSMDVPGLGLVNYFVSLNHIRLLHLAILLPLAVRCVLNKPKGQGVSHRIADVLVLLYLAYVFLSQATVSNVTSMMRGVFDLGIDVWLPYFVASRALRDLRAWREVVAAFVLAVAVMAVIAPFETIKGWLLYDGLRAALDVPSASLGVYLLRGEEGALRANVAVGNSIVLGYVMMVALLLFTYLAPLFKQRGYAVLAVAALFGGLVAALSRGPWVGAAAGLLVALSMGAGGGKRLGWLLGAAALGALALMMLPGGEKIIDHLPFIGTVDEGSVTYRQRLFEVSMSVFWQNPIFGSFYYMSNPAMEEMRQGQGIIDMVNSYLAVALPYGAVGLCLFVAPFAYSGWACWRARSLHGRASAEADRLGRALLGAMAAVLLTIATVSSISVVAPIYWMLAGLCVGYARMLTLREVTPAPVTGAVRPVARQRSRAAA